MNFNPPAIYQTLQVFSVLKNQPTFYQIWPEIVGLRQFCCFRENTEGEQSMCEPAEGLGCGRVVQGSTACLVRLVDLSASAHQGHSALVPPISSRIVQRSPIGRGEEKT